MRLLVMALLAALAACLGAPTMDRNWSDSTNAPAVFSPWEGSEGVRLPAGRPEFLAFLDGVGAQHYSVGAGSDSPLAVPAPRPGSPCTSSAAAIIFNFEIEGGTFPRYVAYVEPDDRIACIDKQFSYRAP